MTKSVAPAVPAAKTLSEQKSDFTAEGSPPPGKVATSVPAGTPEPAESAPPHRPARATIRLKRAPATP